MPSSSISPTSSFTPRLAAFAADLTAKFAIALHFNPEDQLKAPMLTLLTGTAEMLGLTIAMLTEVQDRERSGRPDIGVVAQALLAGYVELKAPGKGADPAKFKTQDRAQWEKFRDLPNLLYTDGNQWALYRGGERVGRLVRLSGDVTSDGAKAVSETDATAVFALLRDFLFWQPTAPATPRALAETLAPLCRLLRTEVLAAVQNPESGLTALAVDWRHYLFPDADDAQFADAYAQTLTYALLLARWSGAVELSTTQATKTLRPQHGLLAEALKILADEQARTEIATPVAVLERVIGAVDPAALASQWAGGDPWLYFYEDFLAVYDPKMRKDRGVYYTPVPVVRAQIALIGELLETRFNAEFSFVDPQVVTLDPAAGTGTYILAALDYALERVAATQGPGMRAQAATVGAHNLHAFEILVGPYAVAHLRLSQRVLAEGGTLPADGAHVYLTDTLEPPNSTPPGHLPLAYRALGQEHQRAQKVKADTAVLVCLGNPPYDRQVLEAGETGQTRKGGWIRYGDAHREGGGLLQDFIAPLNALGLGLYARNLYNDYVYFWRWALWKVFESQAGPGIVGFITASSYLAGPGFAGMRQLMRRTFDELWIIDLEGDNLGARKTDNVFAIQTPVAIVIGARYAEPQPETPAMVRYTRLTGSQAAKFERLTQVQRFADLPWKECAVDWTAPFSPLMTGVFFNWPLVTDLFPWQENGVQFQRSWPIGETAEVLEQRWRALLNAKERKTVFRETGDRKITRNYPDFHDKNNRLPPIASLESNSPVPNISRYAFRSFDRRFALFDNRLGDRMRPDLYRSYGNRQVFLTSFLTEVLGHGPAAVVTALIPDKHHFRGSFGGAHVIPLWRDAAATQANLTTGLLEFLSERYGQPVQPEAMFAYAYALLATPAYVKAFWEELALPGPRLPLTKDAALFAEGAALGQRLIGLHTYGERFLPPGAKFGHVLPGVVRCQVGTPADPSCYPDRFHYDPATQELHIGKGLFAPVRREVWSFSLSGFEVVKSWLAYRMRDRSGKKSSPLDNIRPERWTFDGELLNLLWVLDHTVDLQPALAALLSKVLTSKLFTTAELPKPDEAQRRAMVKKGGKTELFE
ncbi:MAG: DNA methyltransferase [Candidatus Contendobacter sp.]|nr:DNA methyltransferase [Candidatus Contendobacter sp.]